MKPYLQVKKIVKFNNGNGALLCNNCKMIIAYGFDHEDKHHFCNDECQKHFNENKDKLISQ